MSATPVLPLVWIMLAAMLLIVGAAVTLIVWRGRREGDHPVCRRCGFDLVGLPRESAVCSECGADLSHRGSVRIGHRRRRPIALTLGLLALLLSLALLAAMANAYVRRVGVDRLKPTWLLLREARDPTAASAWEELSRRLFEGSLSPSTASTLTERVLAWQADPSRTWRTRWGDFVQMARDGKHVSDAQWQKYARQAPRLALELRPQVRTGDDLPAWIRSRGARVGIEERFQLSITETLHFGEVTRPRPKNWGHGRTTFGLSNTGGSASGHTILLDRAACRAAAEGERDVRVEVEVSVIEPQPNAQDEVPPLVKWKQPLEGKWTLVAADAETVKVIEDESLRPGVEKALTARRVIHQRWDGKGYLRVELSCDKSPVPLAYEAFARDPSGREWKLSRVTFNTGGSIYSGVSGPVEGFAGERVDILFRPSLEAALNTVELTRMWGGEIILKDLAVTKDSSWERK